MSYSGPERRQFCSAHEQLIVDVAVIKEKVLAIDKRINGSINSIEKHIEKGTSWRIGIVGVAAMLIIQTLIFATIWGKTTRTVEVNTGRLAELEATHPRGQSGHATP